MQHDPLNDALSVIKNADHAGHFDCITKPASRLIGRVLKIMQEAGYIGQFEYVEDGRSGQFRIELRGTINNCGVIKPRSAVATVEFDKWESRFLPARDFGVLVLTTNQGVVSHYSAKDRGIGGRLLAYVY